ncbi:MAG: hypothetical protein RL338_1441, partial [Chloroflexota bacterium]
TRLISPVAPATGRAPSGALGDGRIVSRYVGTSKVTNGAMPHALRMVDGGASAHHRSAPRGPDRPAATGYHPRVELELGRPTDRRPPFRYAAVTRVSFSDTDAQGVVYYGRYLPYFDMARVEYLRHLGLVATGAGAGATEFVMRALAVEYVAPAVFDDLLEVFVRTVRIGTSSVTSAYEAYRVADDRLMCRAEGTLVLIDPAVRRPVPVPAGFREAIARFEGETMEDRR